MNESWNRFCKWFVVKPSGSLASVRCSIAQWSGVMFPNSDNCVQRAILVLDNLFFVPRSESFWYPSEQEGRNHQKNANKQTNKVKIRLFLDWLDCGVCCLREFHDTVQLQRTTQGHQVLSQCYDPERFQSIHQQWSLQLRDSAVDISIDRRTETDLFKGHVPLHRQLSPLFVKLICRRSLLLYQIHFGSGIVIDLDAAPPDILERAYCTKIYPIALIFLLPLSGLCVAWLPHVLESSWYPPVPNPILESQVRQSFSWLAI